MGRTMKGGGDRVLGIDSKKMEVIRWSTMYHDQISVSTSMVAVRMTEASPAGLSVQVSMMGMETTSCHGSPVFSEKAPELDNAPLLKVFCW